MPFVFDEFTIKVALECLSLTRKKVEQMRTMVDKLEQDGKILEERRTRMLQQQSQQG